MSAADLPIGDPLLELLLDRATEGLCDGDLSRLEALLAERPDVDPLSLELTAAAIDLAVASAPTEPLPAALRRRVEEDARSFLEGGRSPTPRPGRVARRRPPRLAAAGAVAGWALAAGLAALWLARPLPTETPRAPAADPAARRASFLAAAPDAVSVAWSATGDAAGPEASGDVVWSPALQTGFMRFRGLAANDPTRSQYQLWVFDGARDDRYPVDGGVFDIAPGRDEVVVPIRTRIPISRPVLFAVTVERPGGVVVSSRERLPLVARVGG